MLPWKQPPKDFGKPSAHFRITHLIDDGSRIVDQSGNLAEIFQLDCEYDGIKERSAKLIGVAALARYLHLLFETTASVFPAPEESRDKATGTEHECVLALPPVALADFSGPLREFPSFLQAPGIMGLHRHLPQKRGFVREGQLLDLVIAQACGSRTDPTNLYKRLVQLSHTFENTGEIRRGGELFGVRSVLLCNLFSLFESLTRFF